MPDIRKLAEELGIDPDDPNVRTKAAIMTMRMSVRNIHTVASGNISNVDEIANEIFLSVIDSYINHPEWEKLIPNANDARLLFLSKHSLK